MRRLVYALVALLAFVGAPALANPTFPELTGRVVDDAGILSAGAREQLTGMLAASEQKTGDQVVVATLKSLQGYDIADYSYQLGRHWGIGQKGKDNGVLLVVAPNDHHVRIEVGYGLEGDLTDAQSRVIIEQMILPAFKRGDFDGGVIAGTRAILGVIGGDPNAVPQEAEAAPVPQPHQHHGGLSGIWIILLLFFIFGRGAFWPLLFMSSGRGFGGGFGGGSGGGSNDGGFSGGGGSFGGGGASGQW